MILWQVVVLAVIQGITEFLPVSSSGHLVILQKLFGFYFAPVAFDVLLHLGSLIAIIFFFRKQLMSLIFNWKDNLKLILLIVIGSIPAGLFGFFFKKSLEQSFNSLKFLGISFLGTAVILFSTKLIQKNKAKKMKEITIMDSLIVGGFQALAIFPGISRSGATITAGLWTGFSSLTAFIYSFFLALPAITGATLLELPKMIEQSGGWQFGLIGMTISAIFSYFAMVTLERVLRSKRFFFFGWYCFFLGLFLIFL